MADEFKYWAFLSYSSKDKDWSKWLHRQLDGYKPPRRLVGRLTRDGKIAKEMLPVFRDRDDLAGGSNLDASLQTNLRDSQYLIVICSPNSAGSKYVNAEVQYFKSLGREERVFCFIVGGSPSATGETCCYPPAVRQKYDRDGKPTSEISHPLAPDARPHGDSRRKARTKLIAGLLGVDYNELARREWWRTFWRRTRLASATTAAIAAVSLVGLYAVRIRIDHLTDSGREELLAGKPEAALRSLSRAYSIGGDSAALRFLLHDARLSVTPGSVGAIKSDVWTAIFNPDATRVVTASSGSSVIVWDAATGQVVHKLVGHVGCVNLAIFSPDGNAVLSSCDDGTARIWDVSGENRPTRALDVRSRVRATKVFPAVFSPAGGKIATTCSDGPAGLIWNTATLQPIGEPLRHYGLNLFKPGSPVGIHYISFNPDGSRVITAGLDGVASIWDSSSGRLIASLVHEGALRFASFSPDGSRIVTCGYKGEARLWTKDGKPIAKLDVPADNHARRAAFSPDGKRLAVSSWVGAPTIWNGETGELLFTLNTPDQKQLHAVAISKHGLIAAGGDEGLIVWDSVGRSLRKEGSGHDRPKDGKRPNPIVYGVEFSADGSRLASSGSGDEAYVWDVSDGRTVRRVTELREKPVVGANYRALPGHSAWVTAAGFDHDGRHVFTIDANRRLRAWEKTNDTYRKLEPFPPADVPATAAAFDPSSRRLAIAADGPSGTVTIWDLELKTTVATINFGDVISGLQFVPDQSCVVVNGTRNSTAVVAMIDFSPAARVRAEFPAITRPVFSRSGDKFVVVGPNNVAEVRRTSDGQKIASFGSDIVSAQFSADSTHLFTVNSRTMGATLWSLANGQAVVSFGAGRIECLAVSGDGTRVVTFRQDAQAAMLWDARSGQSLGPLEGDQKYEVNTTLGEQPLYATFSPDGALVVTQTAGDSVGIWDAYSLKLLKQTAPHSGRVTVVAMAPDGSRLLTGAKDAVAQVYDLTYETESPAAVSSFVREMAAMHVVPASDDPKK